MYKSLFAYFFILFPILAFAAGETSYVYIQGDKDLPFYVRVQGKMLPRYAKDYCILPGLKSGEVEIEVLFEQNKVQAEFFKVIVPDNGQKGFLLTRKCKECDGHQYYLCDISTGDVIKPIKK
jgi:hypothetical protein